jgi:DNA-binding NtrC family response regulator
MARRGQFRRDLLYRLDVYKIVVPPLRERSGDIPLLADSFLQAFRAEMDKPVRRFNDEAMAALVGYNWPGNVRELRNAVERSLLSASGSVIELGDLPDKVGAREPSAGSDGGGLADVSAEGLDAWLAGTERRLIVAALKESGGVQVQAARLLGINERSLWHRLKKYDIRVGRAVRE